MRERQHKPWVRQNAREEKRRQDDFRGHGSGQNGYDKYRSDDEGADWIMRVMRDQRSGARRQEPIQTESGWVPTCFNCQEKVHKANNCSKD